MSDKARADAEREPAPRLPQIDFGAQILNGGPSVSQRFRNTQMQQESGAPQTAEPRSNRPKFPDTSGPWWPTDNPAPRSPFSKEDLPLGWGIHWFEAAPPKPEPPPPDKPPAKPEDWPILKPDRIQSPLLTDDEARKSAYINADARSIYLTAGATGAALGVGTHYADLYTGKVAPEARSGLTAFWRNHMSPSQALVPERTLILQGIEAKLPEIKTAANAAEHTLERQIRFRTELIDQLKGQIPGEPLPELEKAWWNARLSMVNDNRLYNSANILGNAGTEAEVQARTRLFTHAEAAPIASQADDFWKAAHINQTAQTTLAETEVARNLAVQRLTQAERGSINSARDSFLRGAGKGLLVATATVAADNLLDRALGNSPELANSAHWGLQGIGMPLLLLSKASTPTKIIGSLAMVGVSHMMDQHLGPPTGIFSAMSRPSLPEVGLATAGALAPVRDPRLRVGLAVGGWLAGKTWNYLDARYELTGRTEPRMRDQVIGAVDYDLKNPGNERFNFAAAEMRKFSDRNESASAVLIRDWQTANASTNLIDRERGSAALMLGQGESLLSRGTRIDRNAWDKTGTRILAGSDYDLGAEASNYLRAATGNLQDAVKLARENKGKDIAGTTIDESYINQLEKLQVSARQSLERVYAKHDIPLVYKQVKDAVSVHPEDMKYLAQKLSQYQKTLSDADARFKAKVGRDLAILHLAFAQNDPASRAEHYREALRRVEESALLDPKSQDLPQIKALLSP
ncbi:MAG: glycoside hydrolase family 52 protein [Candidatus Obscuribacterales bacterium]|nr:glycoside hydrolase family 52 protein [Candidatus Obscuribacterales bacterium]